MLATFPFIWHMLRSASWSRLGIFLEGVLKWSRNCNNELEYYFGGVERDDLGCLMGHRPAHF
jgi:hypothetical protein